MVEQKNRSVNISFFALLSGAGILLAQIAWNRQLLLITGGRFFGREWDNHRSLRVNGVEEVQIDQASPEAFYFLGHYNSDAETAMGRRWLSAALSTGAELLYNEGRFREESGLADMDWEADPEWRRNFDLVIEINRAQSLAQEEY